MTVRAPAIIDRDRNWGGWSSTDDDEPLPPTEDLALMKTVGDLLFSHYPGYLWFVEARKKTGVINIKCYSADPTPDYPDTFRFGFRLKIADLDGDPTFRKVVRAGGELLERAGLRRGRARD